MNPGKIISHIIVAASILAVLFLGGCGPNPPVPYQQLQIQDTEETHGYDVYMYVAVDPAKGYDTPDKVRELLKWFNEVKYPNQNKIKIFVWRNPQSALMNATGDIVGTLTVNRSTNNVSIDVGATK